MADIGSKLKSAREEKGLSIEDVEKTTKIQSRYLTAIENNEFDKLPGDFYVRAFIRQYAQVVGLDGKELLSEYHEEVPEATPDEYVENSIDNKSEEVRETTDNKKNLWKNYLPKIAIALGVIIVILVVYVLYARLSSGGQQNNEADDSSVTVSSQKSSSSSKKTTKKVAASTVKIKRISDNEYRVLGLKKNRRLVVKAGSTQNTSASVAVDGNSTWQSTLIAKQKHTVTLPSNAQRVVITLGNDKGTSITIGGKKIPYAKNNASRTITLLIGKAKKSSSSTSSTQSSTTNNDNNDSSTTTQSSYQSSTQSRTTTQSSQQSSSAAQSSTTTQSSQSTQQSSAAQSSTTTQDNGTAGGNNGGNENNGN